MGTPSNLRRHAHVDAAVTYLRRLGADDVDVLPRQSRIQIAWRLGDDPMRISVSRAASGDQKALCDVTLQRVRQQCRAHGLEVRA